MQIFSRYTIGVEISREQIVIVGLHETTGGSKLFAHEVLKLDSSLTSRERSVRSGELIKSFIDEHSIYQPDIHVAIPRNIVIVKEVSFPLAIKENLRESMRYEVEKFVPFAASEIYFDCKPVSIDKKASSFTVMLIVAKKEDLDPYFALQADTGALSVIETASTALARGISLTKKLQWEDDPGFLLIREENGLQCDFIENGQLRASLFIACDIENAESRLSKTIQALCRKSAVIPEKCRMWYLGDDNMPPLIGKTFNGIPLEAFPDCESLPEDILLPAYFLAERGEAAGQVNLLPEKLRKRPSRKSLYTTIGLTGIVIVLSVAIAGNYFYRKNAIKAMYDNEIARLNKDVSGIPQLEEDIRLLGIRISHLTDVEGRKTILLDALHELTILIPETAWINSLNFSDDSMRIDGSAQSASELIELLESSYLFEDVAFLAAVRKNKEGMETFSIGFTVKR